MTLKEELRIAKCRLAEYELREKSMHKNFMALHSKFMDRIYQMDDEVISYVIELARNNGTIECMTYYFNSIIDRRNQVIEVLIKDLKQLLLPSYYKYLISIAENFSRFDEFSNQFPRRDMRDEFVKVTEKVKEDCYELLKRKEIREFLKENGSKLMNSLDKFSKYEEKVRITLKSVDNFILYQIFPKIKVYTFANFLKWGYIVFFWVI